MVRFLSGCTDIHKLIQGMLDDMEDLRSLSVLLHYVVLWRVSTM
jgi:hypothetical protein